MTVVFFTGLVVGFALAAVIAVATFAVMALSPTLQFHIFDRECSDDQVHP